MAERNCYRCVGYESHRCRNEKECPDGLHYEEYIGSTVRQCLCATIEVFQDGYIHCPILDSIGCEQCMKDFGDGSEFYYDESQNYERKPSWKEVEEVGKKKVIEQKSCKRLKESSGPAMPKMYIGCEQGRISFESADEFYKMFDICNHRPEECERNQPETCANCTADKEECQPYQVCMNENLKPEECVCNDWKQVKKKGIEVDIDTYEKVVDAHNIDVCETCEYSEDWGESVEYIKCSEGKKRKDVRKKQPACDNYIPVSDIVDDEPEGYLEEQLEELLEEGDRQDQTYIYRGLV